MTKQQPKKTKRVYPIRTWHPHAEAYPLLDGEEYERFKADMAERGQLQPILFRLKDGRKEGLDGRNRLRACQDLDIKPKYKQVGVADDAVEAFIDSQNLHRRHLSKEERQVRVEAMKARGASNRQIAATLGVGETTVRRDSRGNHANSSENNGPGAPNGAPGKVEGSDGKLYPATRDALIPEFAARRQQLSPKVVTTLESFSKPLQRDILREEAKGVGLRKAIHIVSNQREPGVDEKRKPSANGRVLVNWKGFTDPFGKLQRWVDETARGMNISKSPVVRDLNKLLDQTWEMAKRCFQPETVAASGGPDA